MTVGNYCERNLALLTRDASLQEVAMMMRIHHLGEVIIIDKIDGKNIPVGVITDRDLVIEIMALEVDVEQMSAGSIMSLELITVRQDYGLSDTLDIMQQHGVRRLPVVDNSGTLLGIINIKVILKVLCQDLSKLPTIGHDLAANLIEILETGRQQQPQKLSKHDKALTVFCTQISALVNLVRLILPDIAKDQDIEVLHQYRVSLRQVETLLFVFHNFVPKEIILDMKADIKALFTATGQLRDLDLLLRNFQQTNLKSKHTFPDKKLKQAITAKRQDEFERFMGITQNTEYTACFVRLQTSLHKVGQLSTQVTLKHCWPSLIGCSMDNVHTAYQHLWKQKDAPHIHKLRKNLKQLRYCIELIGPVIKPRKAKSVLAWLKNQQKSLGDYNDLLVQSGLLKGHDRANNNIKRVLKTANLTEIRKSLPLSKSDWKTLRKKIHPLVA